MKKRSAVKFEHALVGLSVGIDVGYAATPAAQRVDGRFHRRLLYTGLLGIALTALLTGEPFDYRELGPA